eukprot:scaffold3319_cov427-Prasinococcus_capsulatus_cf.AAC.8
MSVAHEPNAQRLLGNLRQTSRLCSRTGNWRALHAVPNGPDPPSQARADAASVRASPWDPGLSSVAQHYHKEHHLPHEVMIIMMIIIIMMTHTLRMAARHGAVEVATAPRSAGGISRSAEPSTEPVATAPAR